MPRSTEKARFRLGLFSICRASVAGIRAATIRIRLRARGTFGPPGRGPPFPHSGRRVPRQERESDAINSKEMRA